MFNIRFVWNVVRGFLFAEECGPGTFSFRMIYEALGGNQYYQIPGNVLGALYHWLTECA